MPSVTDSNRRPLYIDRRNNRVLAEPIGAGPWPVIDLTPPIPSVPPASLTQAGIVQLSDSISSNSTTTAATPSAVKATVDIAQTSAVDTTRLVNSSVTEAKLASNAVTTNKIADASITGAKLAADAALSPYTITTTGTDKTLANRERCSVTLSGLTITLPSSPQAGWEVSVVVAGGFNNTLVARNGANIMSLAEDLIIDRGNVTVTFLFVDATRGWRII